MLLIVIEPKEQEHDQEHEQDNGHNDFLMDNISHESKIISSETPTVDGDGKKYSPSEKPKISWALPLPHYSTAIIACGSSDKLFLCSVHGCK